jgi:nucleoid DNA-binding protein
MHAISIDPNKQEVTVNTTEIIYEIARRSKQTSRPLTREEVTVAIDLMLAVLLEELLQPNGTVHLKRIGTLQIVQHTRSGGRLKRGYSPTLTQSKCALPLYRLKLRVSRSFLRQLRQLA